jgi:hypothetical protein
MPSGSILVSTYRERLARQFAHRAEELPNARSAERAENGA